MNFFGRQGMGRVMCPNDGFRERRLTFVAASALEVQR